MIQLGPYTTGEIPSPLQVTFKTSTGTPLDLSSGTYVARWVIRPRGGVPVTQTAVVTSPSSGVTTYTWVAADFAVAGDFEAELWVGNGTNRFCSQRYAFHVHQAIQTPVI